MSTVLRRDMSGGRWSSLAQMSGTRLTHRVPLLAIFAVAVTARLGARLAGGGLFGMHGYDDGVYYTSAVALLHGLVPYRDFLLLHPPGITLLLTPFALVGHLTSDGFGLAVARVVFAGIGAVNAVLVARILLRRFGLQAAVVGGAVYALAYPGVHGEGGPLLEPLGNLGLLLAIWWLQRREHDIPRWMAFAAGAAVGMTAAVKVWGLVPLLAIAAWQWREGGRQAASRVLAGGVAAVTAVCLPFFVLAPGTMLRMVVLDQLGRSERWYPVVPRLRLLFGPWTIRPDGSVSYALQGPWPPVLVVVAAALLLAATSRGARLYAALFVVLTAMVLLTPPFFLQYATVVMPPAALVAGAAWDRILRLPVVAAGDLGTLRRAATGLVVLVVLAYSWPGLTSPDGTRMPERLVAAAGRVQGCVLSDSPVAMVELDVLSRNLDRGCRIMVDVTGLTYDADAGSAPVDTLRQRTGNPAWQRDLLAYLRTGTAVVLVRPGGDGLAEESEQTIHSWPVVARAGGFQLRAPR